MADDETKPEERFDKAYFVTLALLFVFLPVVLIPVMGFMVYAIIITFFAGRSGGRYLCHRHALLSTIMATLTFLMIALGLFYLMIPYIVGSMVGELNMYESLGTLGILAFSIVVLVFSSIGGYTGGKPRKYFEG